MTPTAQIVAIGFVVVLFAVGVAKALYRRRLSTEQKLRVIEALDKLVMYQQIGIMIVTGGAVIAFALGAYAVAMNLYAVGLLALSIVGFLSFQRVRRLDLPTGYVVVSGIVVAVIAFGGAAWLVAVH